MSIPVVERFPTFLPVNKQVLGPLVGQNSLAPPAGASGSVMMVLNVLEAPLGPPGLLVGVGVLVRSVVSLPVNQKMMLCTCQNTCTY